MTPIDLVKGQLLAYNAHEVDLFCTYFANDVVVYDGRTHQVLFEGMEAFKERYTHTLSNPNLHCELLNRIEQGNIIIDHERVTGVEKGVVFAIAVYKIEDGKIQTVTFY